jgi:hypothetical protein
LLSTRGVDKWKVGVYTLIMKQCTGEICTVFWEDGHKVAVEFQNGTIERFMLKPATKADSASLLGVDEKNAVQLGIKKSTDGQ